MQSNSLFFVMPIAFLLANSCDSSHVEIEALAAFKHNIVNDTHGVLADWNGMDSNPCEWTGVSCIPGTWGVNKLSLVGTNFTNFTGYLVPILGNLTHLVDLNLSANKFNGTIPSELEKRKSLRVLDLSYNNLQGQIPVQVGRLQNLEFLCLRNNTVESLETLVEKHLQAMSSKVKFPLKNGCDLHFQIEYLKELVQGLHQTLRVPNVGKLFHCSRWLCFAVKSLQEVDHP
eukprot:Gb_36087 [translate_table: standard]